MATHLSPVPSTPQAAGDRFASVDDMVSALQPAHPVFCLRPAVVAGAARHFVEAFPGRVLYAVKCNPHPWVLSALYEGGVRDFDTASLPEIESVRGLFSDANAYFHHPIKSRDAIRRAYRDHGVRQFTVDHPAELDKLVEECGGDIEIEVRFATPPGFATFDLSTKFGATPQHAVRLLRAVADKGLTPTLAFHVGSQCTSPEAYRIALLLAGQILDAAEVTIASLNVGGGFPADYPNAAPAPLQTYFDEIEAGVRLLELPDGCGLLCEPGRALVADGCSLVVQVDLRKDNVLYVNDGIYGSLSEMVHGKADFAVRLVRPGGAAVAASESQFTVFGPTCDANDVLPFTWILPDDVREGDWIEVSQVGAYSNAMASHFNGFYADTFVKISGR